LTFWLQIVYDQSVVLARTVRKAAAKTKRRWLKVMRYTKPATLNQFEAGPHIGSMTSLQKTEKGQFWQILSKATGFYQAAENTQLNSAERRSQSQKVL
jgi:hypothetical protein